MSGRRVSFIVSGLIAWQVAAGAQLTSIGDHIFGPKLTLDDLKGHVVIVEQWGKS